MDIGGKFCGDAVRQYEYDGQFRRWFCRIAIGYILAWSGHNWNVALYVAAGVYFLGTFCWLAIDPVTPIDDST